MFNEIKKDFGLGNRLMDKILQQFNKHLYINLNKILTKHIQHQGHLLRRHQKRIRGLTGKDSSIIATADLRPQKPVFYDITRVVFVLFVDKDSVYQPPYLWFWTT